MAIYMPNWVEVPEDETNWYVMLQNQDDPAIGYQVTLAKSTNVRAIKVISEGAARPAWYPAFTPDAKHAGLDQLTTPHNSYYWFMDGRTVPEWGEWTIPAEAAGFDKLVVTYTQVSGGGTVEIYQSDTSGSGGTLIGSFSTDGPTTVYETAVTVDLSAPLASQYLRFVATVERCRVNGFYAYDSDGAATAGQPFALPASTVITKAASSYEFAYAIQPAAGGSGAKWVGGYIHQGATNCTEVNVVETWGSAIAAGWNAGPHTMSRTSDIEYDAGPPQVLLGSIACDYTITDAALKVSHRTTVSQDWTVSLLYPAMYAASTAAACAVLGNGRMLDLAPLGDGAGGYQDISVSAAELLAARRVGIGPTPLGGVAVQRLLAITHSQTAAFVRRHQTDDKWYHRFAPTCAQNDIIGADWELTYATAAPARRPSGYRRTACV